jgi:hypothetical protein
MSRQLDHASRIFHEMKDRYGEGDPLVSQWRSELDVREAFEFQYPAKLIANRSFLPQRGATLAYERKSGKPNLDDKSALVNRLLARH